MVDGLVMGVDLLDVGQLRFGLCQKIVVDLDPYRSNDSEFSADHEIVYLFDRTGGTVFNGDHAVMTHSAFDGVKYLFPVGKKADVRRSEEPFCRQLGVSALHSLTGNRSTLGKDPRRGFYGLGDLLVEGGFDT